MTIIDLPEGDHQVYIIHCLSYFIVFKNPCYFSIQYKFLVDGEWMHDPSVKKKIEVYHLPDRTVRN